jgi:hypothetical protein
MNGAALFPMTNDASEASQVTNNRAGGPANPRHRPTLKTFFAISVALAVSANRSRRSMVPWVFQSVSYFAFASLVGDEGQVG